VRDLRKSYNGTVLAVDGLSFSVDPGTVYALLGPNGAGKSTTLGVLTTMHRATSGSARVLGLNVDSESRAVRQVIGVTFQELILDGELTGYQILDFQGKLYGMGRRERKEAIPPLLALVELQRDADRKCKTYSGGMKRRLELVRSLLTRPRVLFLDEPTLGLDPVGREQIWEYIRRVRHERELTVVLTTHYLDEAHKLADRIGILNRGRLVAEGSPDELIAHLEEDVVSLRYSPPDGAAGPALAAELQEKEWVKAARAADGMIQVEVDAGSRRLAAIITMATALEIDVEDVQVHKPDLGSVFLEYTGTQMKEAT
jgi:ABC-2 type transport system ATP-binding protein